MKRPEPQILDNGRLVVTAEFVPLLQQNGLETFEQVMARSPDFPVRQFPGRTMDQIDLRAPAGDTAGVFLKRYHSSYLSLWRCWGRFVGWPSARDEAEREWRMHHQLRACGFETPEPIAFGQTKAFGIVRRSFFMTAQVQGGIPADYYLPRLHARARWNFMRRAGALTRRFHQAGFVHKDYYLSHLFLRRGLEPEMLLIDLQRVTRGRWLRERGRVKDLAAFADSALRCGARRADLFRFFHAYLARPRLEPGDKRFIRKVLARLAWQQQRRPKHDRNFDRRKKT